jgi:hypothetical protein
VLEILNTVPLRVEPQNQGLLLRAYAFTTFGAFDIKLPKVSRGQIYYWN